MKLTIQQTIDGTALLDKLRAENAEARRLLGAQRQARMKTVCNHKRDDFRNVFLRERLPAATQLPADDPDNPCRIIATSAEAEILDYDADCNKDPTGKMITVWNPDPEVSYPVNGENGCPRPYKVHRDWKSGKWEPLCCSGGGDEFETQACEQCNGGRMATCFDVNVIGMAQGPEWPHAAVSNRDWIFNTLQTGFQVTDDTDGCWRRFEDQLTNEFDPALNVALFPNRIEITYSWLTSGATLNQSTGFTIPQPWDCVSPVTATFDGTAGFGLPLIDFTNASVQITPC